MKHRDGMREIGERGTGDARGPHDAPRAALSCVLFAAPVAALSLLSAAAQAQDRAQAPAPALRLEKAASTCISRSASTVPPLVELYTSEGCNSCPPADRWLSKLKSDPDVVALAFHVDYWDRLGWKDRFASPAFTQRQTQQRQSNGARFSYTPQVVLDGADHPRWFAAPAPSSTRSRPRSAVDVVLTRDGDLVTATVRPGERAPASLAAYWAVTEQGHVTAVKAGENQGETLTHDFVVRDYLPVTAWPAQPGASSTLTFRPGSAASPDHPRHVNLVVTDAETGKPVQAVKLGC